MDLENARRLMKDGDVRTASEVLSAILTEDPGNVDAKLLLGVCRRLEGDEESFIQIGDELERDTRATQHPMWATYHAMKVAACGAMLLLATGVSAAPMTLYGIAGYNAKLSAPTPSATDGKYLYGVRVSWKAVKYAQKYQIRRATSANYSKSKVIATVTGTSYYDKTTQCYPKKKFYYWVVPYNLAGKGFKNTKRYNSGYTKRGFKVSVDDTTPYVGERVYFWASDGVCHEIAPSACKYTIVSGSSCASISKKGFLTAKKAGTVKVKVTWKGLNRTITIKIRKSTLTPAYGVAVAEAFEYVDRVAPAVFVMPLLDGEALV